MAPPTEKQKIVPGKNMKKFFKNHDILQNGGLTKYTKILKSYVQKEKGWSVKHTPIGDGAVNFKKYFQLLQALKINKPISVHAEYELGGAGHGAKQITISSDKVIAALKQDLTRLKQFL